MDIGVELNQNIAPIAALKCTGRNTTMYDVTITDCETLEVTHKRVENPLEVLNGIDWLELHAQHEAEAQFDFRVTTDNGEIIHIKARGMT